MFYFVNNMFGNSQFKLLGIDGVKPSRETIMRGEYPVEDHYYAVIRKDTPEDHPARKLIDWILSDEGQTLAVRAGYIPLRPMENVWPDNALDPIFLGDVYNASGTGGTVLKTGVEDVQPVNGVRPPISDLFFDGFNYIQYINGEIMRWLDSFDLELWQSVSWGEQYLMRPFTGIPNDYPNYEIHNLGNMIISFPADNPFFGRGMTIYIRLTEDISPYGVGLPALAITYDYAGRIMPRIDFHTLQISIGDYPEVSARLNESLTDWLDTFPWGEEQENLLGDFIEWYSGQFVGDWASGDWAYRLQPTVERWREYISVSYILQLYDGPSFNMPMVNTISFEIETGRVVDLANRLPDDLDYRAASGFTLIDFNVIYDWGWPQQDYMPEGYIPAEGSIITDAWIAYGMLNLNLTEPDGRVLQFIFWEM
jgi:hypothetical protein